MNSKSILLVGVLSLAMMMNATAFGIDIENFDGITGTGGNVDRVAAGGDVTGLYPESTIVQSGDSLRVDLDSSISVNGNLQATDWNKNIDLTGQTDFQISIHLENPDRVGKFAIRLFSGRDTASWTGVQYTFQNGGSFVSGWNTFSTDFNSWGDGIEGTKTTPDISDIDAWTVEIYGQSGAPHSIYLDNLIATPEPVTLSLLGLGALAVRARKGGRKRLG